MFLTSKNGKFISEGKFISISQSYNQNYRQNYPVPPPIPLGLCKEKEIL